eukprot:233650-Chlamydomonas_euryale.AAC.2
MPCEPRRLPPRLYQCGPSHTCMPRSSSCRCSPSPTFRDNTSTSMALPAAGRTPQLPLLPPPPGFRVKPPLTRNSDTKSMGSWVAPALLSATCPCCGNACWPRFTEYGASADQ